MITPLGIGVDALWNGLMERRSAVRPAEGFDVDDMPATRYAQLPAIDFDEYLDPRQSALWSDASKLGVTGAMLAVRDAGGATFDPGRTGVILGTGYGCVYEFEELYRVYLERGWKRVKPNTVPKLMPNAPASQIGIHLGARGINFTVSTACSSGAIAAGLAAQQIRTGLLDACVTGGLDRIVNRSIAACWNNLRVLSRRADETASRPFSKDRDGLVFGEGCAILVLEEFEAAKARGARIYAELAGVGASNDATNIVGPSLEGEVAAIREALCDAGIGPKEVDYVNAHGTSTQVNDANESRTLEAALGTRAKEIPVSSIKGAIGHTMGASGAIEVAATALAIHHQRVPPTLHLTPGDPDCDLDYVADGPRDQSIDWALTESFGFGGQNSALVLRRVES